MRKLFTTLMAVLVTAVAWAGTYTFTNGKFSFSAISDNECECTGLSDYGKNYVNLEMPFSVMADNGKIYRICSIAQGAFKGNTSIKSIDLSATTGLRTIGQEAFSGCTSLTSATLRMGVVGTMAFYGCTSLTSLKLGEVTGIGMYSFAQCTSLTSVTLPASLTQMTYSAFTGCSSLRNYYVDEGNTILTAQSGVLYNKDKTTLIRVPEAKTSVVWASTVTAVQSAAMQYCTKLASITVPYGVKSVGDMAFAGCASLTEVSIPSSVQTLGNMTFSGCTSLANLYINMYRVPTINKNDMFGAGVNPNLYVQQDSVYAFKKAGWTDFKSYNKDSIVPYDAFVNGMGFTVTSLGQHSGFDMNNRMVTFDGTARVVRSKWNSNLTLEASVPRTITLHGKEYAVNKIDKFAFNARSPYVLSGCLNVDTVAAGAFRNQPVTSADLTYVSCIERRAFEGCKSLTTVKWGHNLRDIGDAAFKNSGLECDIILPPYSRVESEAFVGVNSKLLLVPYEYLRPGLGYKGDAFDGMTSLETIIMNSPYCTDLYLKDVPNTCKVYVRVGFVDKFKSLKRWKQFASIEEGAYDFIVGDDPNGPKRITVTNFVRDYAEYVYNDKIKSSGITTFDVNDRETVSFGSDKEYIITGIGDRCFEGSNLQSIDLTQKNYLRKIGERAFYNTKLSQVEVNSHESIAVGADAFSGNPNLKEVIFSSPIEFDKPIFANNASDFVAYVQYRSSPKFYTMLENAPYGNGDMCSEHLGLHFVANSHFDTYPFGAIAQVEFGTDSGVKAYIVNQTDPSTGVAQAQRVDWVPYMQGVILTGLTPGKVYLFKPKKRPATPASDNLLVTVESHVDINPIRDTYYWSFDEKKFKVPTDTYNITRGDCYLKATDYAPEYTVTFNEGGKKGDVNGDGTIDVTDVNLAINVMLGKATKAQYPAADVNGDGTVDVTDVNLIINSMLGK